MSINDPSLQTCACWAAQATSPWMKPISGGIAPSDSDVRSPLEQMFEFGMRGPPSSFNIPRCRVQPCPAEDVNVRDQTLRREYSVGGHEAHGFALFKLGSQTSLVARGLLGHRKRIRTTMTISHSPAQEFK